MVSISTSGSFKRTEQFLKGMTKLPSIIVASMEAIGKEGVEALKNATPRDSGRAAYSWGYEVTVKNGVYSLTFTNSDLEEGFPVAVMIQYGYATGTGGYVQGEDYINPALRSIFDRLRDKVWKAVTSA